MILIADHLPPNLMELEEIVKHGNEPEHGQKPDLQLLLLLEDQKPNQAFMPPSFFTQFQLHCKPGQDDCKCLLDALDCLR